VRGRKEGSREGKAGVDTRGRLAGWLLVNVTSNTVLVCLLLVFALDG